MLPPITLCPLLASAFTHALAHTHTGELFSDDDFYLLSTGLMVLETTNHIYVGDVYAPLQPHCVLSWQRIRLANWMAATGEEWVDVFGRFNSGTYNNQVETGSVGGSYSVAAWNGLESACVQLLAIGRA